MQVDFKKYADELAPAIVQDATTRKVLMLGYMNAAALQQTQESGKLCFYSRSKQRLWTKGEESGNFLLLESMAVDCDKDAILLQANPVGPTCHKGTDTCWGEENKAAGVFLEALEATIAQRRSTEAPQGSYVKSLFEKGLNKIAQKVGEEAVEVVIEAKDNNNELFLNESADLLFHYLILLQAKGFRLQDVIAVLEQRAKG